MGVVLAIAITLTAASDTSPNQDYVAVVVTICSCVMSLVLFNFAFDVIRLRHVSSVMVMEDYLEPANLAAQVASFETRTMSPDTPLLKGGQRFGGGEKTTSQNPMGKATLPQDPEEGED